MDHAPAMNSRGEVEGLIAQLQWEAGKVRIDYPSADRTVAKAIDALRALDARVRELEAATAWRPIETAPKDGSRILLWSPLWGGRPVFGRFDEDRFAKKPRPFWRTDTDRIDGLISLRDFPPTHWMPLPSAPVSAARDHDGGE